MGLRCPLLDDVSPTGEGNERRTVIPWEPGRQAHVDVELDGAQFDLSNWMTAPNWARAITG
jgi:hypothetical protein